MRVDVSWNPSAGATKYTVYRSSTAGARGAALADVTGTAYSDTSVVAGQTYFYGVSANNASGESAESAQVPASIPSAGGPIAVRVSRDAPSNMDPYNKDMQWYSAFKTNDGGGLFAAGGYHSPGTSTNAIRKYHPTTRTWESLKPDNSINPTGYAPGTTDWFSTDNTISMFIPSLFGGTYIQGNQVVYDDGNREFLASDIKAFNPALSPDFVENFIDMPLDERTFAGYNAACGWCEAADVGISTTPVQSGNQNVSNRWFWVEKTGNPAKPLRTVFFSPPPLFTAQNFYPDDAAGFGGWVNNRNFCQVVGEHFYVGGGFVHTPALDNQWSFRPNKRFFKIHIPSLRAATTDAEKNATVTELAPCPLQAYYPALSYDELRNRFLLFVGTATGSSILCYDVASDIWSDVTPADQIGSAPDYDGWTPFSIAGWMAFYHRDTDAHYVREGVSQSATYGSSQYVYAGRMRKVQFVDAPSGGVTAPSTPAPDVPSAPAPDVPSTPAAGSRYAVLQHGGGQPFNHQDSGLKHVALLHDAVADELIQGGGDYFGQIYMTVPTPSAPTPREYGPYHSGGKRDAWMCKPKADGAVLNWQCVQPMFMPYGQNQGPSGPDQIWLFMRTAGGRREIYWMPGAWRGFQYETDNNLPPELKGDPYKPFRWLRPGWKPLPARDKMPAHRVTDPTKQFGINTEEPDKFCDYDPTSDAAYCINDDFEIIKFGFDIMDWSSFNLGRPAKDDSGRAITNLISSGGSLQAIVGRRIYCLGAWFEHVNGPTHSGLCWFDIDAKTRGFIPAPFDVDPLCFVPNVQPPLQFGQRNPEESAGLVALGTKLVVMRTYDVVPQGGKCIWIYDTATGQWTEGEPAPFTLWGRAWCALPYDNSVIFFGTADAPYERDPSVFKYRIAA